MSRCCMAPDTFAAPISIKSSTGITSRLTLSIRLLKPTMPADKTQSHKISVWQVFVVIIFFCLKTGCVGFVPQSDESVRLCGRRKCEKSRE